MSRFTGRRVFITAGASGIGAVLARRFLKEGAEVAICDADTEAVAAVPEGVRGFVADVTDESSMAEVFAALDADWGGVDVVCANAGTGGPAGAVDDLALDDWRACLAVNLDGAFLTCRWAARQMKAAGQGVILLTSSTAGLFGYPMRSPYAVAKWGIVGLTKTLAMELGPHGVRVNALCPGAVEGDRMDRVVAAEAAARGMTEADVRDLYVRGVSLRSWVTADEVAEAALFLASDAGAKISGQALPIDGHTETLAP